jgi:hypothetical protein
VTALRKQALDADSYAVELSDDAVRQLYLDHKWSLTKIGDLVGRPPTWTAAVLERQGVPRRPAQQSGRRAPKPKSAQIGTIQPVAHVADTKLDSEDLAYAASRTAYLPMPSQPYDGNISIGLLLLINHATPFRLAPQAALRLVYGLEDGRRWPVSKACRAVGAVEWYVRRAKRRIDERLVAWQATNGARDVGPR